MLENSRIMNIERLFNTMELMGIIVTLMMAFVFQIVLKELPCPLCLLQRIGFLGIAFGFLMNLRFGLRPSHYAMVLLSALYTSFVALRQISLHVIPGTGSYGNAIFGLHLYTWSFIISMIIVVVTTIMLGVDRQYQIRGTDVLFTKTAKIIAAILFILLVANIISVLFECGLMACPDNPTHYL